MLCLSKKKLFSKFQSNRSMEGLNLGMENETICKISTKSGVTNCLRYGPDLKCSFSMHNIIRREKALPLTRM